MPFVVRLVTKYLLYGYLCLLGIAILLGVGVYCNDVVASPWKWVGFVLVAFCQGLLLVQFIKIIATTGYKYRYYKIYLYRLRTRGYKDEYFEKEMYEPCFRLIIKDVLFSRGYKNEYYALCKKCAACNMKVEDAKSRLLKKVQQKYRYKE